MGWQKKASAVIVLLLVSMLVHGKTDKPAPQTTVMRYQIGQLPVAAKGAGGAQNFCAGQFLMGVHNNALIVAGGGNAAHLPAQQVADGQQGDNSCRAIWVATRDTGADRNGDHEITPDERPLAWHQTKLTLPRNWTHSVSATHALGVIAIGSTDGAARHSEVVLLGWNADTQQARLLKLPRMPGLLAAGGAAVIGNTLYVMAGSPGAGATRDLYSFDLLRIPTDDAGNPLTDGDRLRIIDALDNQGVAVNPWQQLPSLPHSGGENLQFNRMIVVAQNDGRGGRLYVIGGRDTSAPARNTDTILAKPDDQQTSWRESRQVWAYNPEADSSTTAWLRKADISVEDQPVSVSAGAGVALGQSHILLWARQNNTPNNTNGPALAYNAITDAWTSYKSSPVTPPTIATHDTNHVTIAGVRWEGDIILARIDTTLKNQPPEFWAMKVMVPASHFGWPNMTVLIVYLLSVMMIGAWFIFKNANTDDYFRAGQNIPWWAAACSIYGTLMSSLTFVALPALVYRTDWLVYLGSLTVLLVLPVVIFAILPFFRQIDATSAYEYLSKRFNMPVRLFASALFTLFHIGRIGIVLALTALAVAAVTPLDATQAVLIMGMLSLIYCTLGGVEAVIWTDTLQVFVLLTGALICFGFMIAGIDGGFSGFIDGGMADNKFRMLNLDFGPGSITTLSIWVVVLGGIGQNLSSYSADQAVVQRYMTTKDTRAAAKSLWTIAVIELPFSILFFLIGVGLYAFYQSQPGKLDPTIQIDQIFPTFIGAELPIGIAGLVVAGIFAAAQSTVSTSMNSIATTLVTDFMRPFNACHSEQGYLNVARLLTFLIGVLGTLAGLLFISPEIRSLMEEYFKVIGMFMGALGGLFVLGMTTRRANGRGALAGLFASVGVMVAVWQFQWANGYLFATISILSCLLIGYLASVLLPSDHHDIDGLTIYTMHRNQSVLGKR